MSGSLTYLLVYLLVGSFTGVLAGLFGVGGGTVIVPALLMTFAAQQVSAEVATHLAIGSSLAIISITAISSVRAHHERGAVDWAQFRQLAPAVCVGVWIGAILASLLSGTVLQKCFAVFLLTIAAQMGFNLQPVQHTRAVPGWLSWLAGFVIGLLSALFGIGGGSLTVPFLSWHGVRMQRAVATAAAVGLPIAVAGALSYIWRGWHHTGLPDLSSGFVYWPACIGITLGSVWFARLGAQMAHALDAQKLKKAFAIFLCAVGVWLLVRP